MNELFEKICSHLEKGKTGVMATIIKGTGSIPQGIGAKIFIDELGAVTGSIGGGCVEAKTWQEARRISGSEETRIIHYTMNNTEVAEEGMICGGNIEIFIEPVLPRYYDIYKEYLRSLKESLHCIIITKTGSRFSKTLFTADSRIMGDPLDDSILCELKNKSNEKQLFFLNGFLVEPVVTKSRLFIYGAGHISQFISRVAKMIDFNVTVIDDRVSFANRERFPEADNIIVSYFTEAIDEISFNPADFHVIVTRGHRHDADVLEEILKKPFAYVGMIGSKRKIKLVYDHLKKNGMDYSQLDRVRAPIGIDVSAVTPQEIAVSIACELIKERAMYNC